MGKKVLIISTGLRKNGNSDLLAQPFARGAEEDEENDDGKKKSLPR